MNKLIWTVCALNAVYLIWGPVVTLIATILIVIVSVIHNKS